MASLGSLIPSQDNQDKFIIHITTLHKPSCIFGPIINQIKIYNANPWCALVKYFLKLGIFPRDMTKTERRCFKQKCAKYTLLGDILYKRGYEGILLRCLEPNEIPLALSQAHDGTCCGHFSGIVITKCLLSMGYFWPTLEKECFSYVCKCIRCQQFANLQHLPSQDLQPIVTIWPFS